MLETIKSSTEISNIFNQGEHLNAPSVRLIIKKVKQHDRNGRVAFIAGKKNGNAVWRNKAKRRMRSLCLESGGPWQGYDVIFLAKRGINQVSYSKVRKEIDTLLMRYFNNNVTS